MTNEKHGNNVVIKFELTVLKNILLLNSDVFVFLFHNIGTADKFTIH